MRFEKTEYETICEKLGISAYSDEQDELNGEPMYYVQDLLVMMASRINELEKTNEQV